MPCRSEYMQPNEKEMVSRETAKLLVYASERAGDEYAIETYLPRGTKAAAKNQYGNIKLIDALVFTLCGLCRRLEDHKNAADDIIYDGRNPKARQLADWWQKHQKFDVIRQSNCVFAFNHNDPAHVAGAQIGLREVSIGYFSKYLNKEVAGYVWVEPPTDEDFKLLVAKGECINERSAIENNCRVFVIESDLKPANWSVFIK